MKGPELQEPAYVLHRRPWRETSLMVDLFALNHGRMTVIARGANSAKSPLKAQLQPFQPLVVDWAGRGDLKTLTQVDVRTGPTITRTVSLYSGLYLNELLQRVLPAADPHPNRRPVEKTKSVGVFTFACCGSQAAGDRTMPSAMPSRLFPLPVNPFNMSEINSSGGESVTKYRAIDIARYRAVSSRRPIVSSAACTTPSSMRSTRSLSTRHARR